jgi:hypothetical protein
MKAAHLLSKLPYLYFLLFCTVTFSCKKKENVFQLEGKVTNARTGSAISNATVTLDQKTAGNGVVNAGFTEATNTRTNSAGMYLAEWPSVRLVELRVSAEATNYFSASEDLREDSFVPEVPVTQNIALYPKADLQISLRNQYSVNSSDLLIFSLPNAQFDCPCCTNETNEYIGSLDTVYTCSVYGDTWIKYRVRVSSISQDSLSVDSLFCPAFQTTALEVTY